MPSAGCHFPGTTWNQAKVGELQNGQGKSGISFKNQQKFSKFVWSLKNSESSYRLLSNLNKYWCFALRAVPSVL